MGYFYALVTQLPISDLRSTVIFVEVTIRSVFGGLGIKKACSTQAETNHKHRYAHCYTYMYSASRAYHSALVIQYHSTCENPLEKVLLIHVTVC